MHIDMHTFKNNLEKTREYLKQPGLDLGPQGMNKDGDTCLE